MEAKKIGNVLYFYEELNNGDAAEFDIKDLRTRYFNGFENLLLLF